MDELKPNKVHLRRAFITGFVALFPIVLTVVVLYLCWRTIEEISKPLGDLFTYIVSLTTGIGRNALARTSRRSTRIETSPVRVRKTVPAAPIRSPRASSFTTR